MKGIRLSRGSEGYAALAHFATSKASLAAARRFGNGRALCGLLPFPPPSPLPL